MRRIRVLIVDDHVVVREGLRQILELAPDIEVVGEAENGLECLKLIEQKRPDLIFMDVRMPGISGIETTRLVCERFPDVRVIVLTIYEDAEHVKESIKAGAKGYVLKKAKREELIRIARDAMEDRAFLDPTVVPAVFRILKEKADSLGCPKETGQEGLTGRELEVLKGIVDGHKDRAIAAALHISEHTVRSHVKSLYRKLGVSSRSQAVLKAVREGIIQGSGC
ncbi:MAG: response regulator transcription factor [bacterium]